MTATPAHTPPMWSAALQALLPPGRAWACAPGSMMAQYCDALAEEFARIEARAGALLGEFSPFTALELLPDWEVLAGLPDPCLPVSGTVRERQLRVGRKVTSSGGQSRQFFIDLAGQMGLAIEIDEFRPFAFGMRFGQPLYGPEWRFAWRVRLLPFSEEATGLALRESRFRFGQSRFGDRLRSFSVSELECVIRRAAPAHSKVLFIYPVDPEPVFSFDFLSDQGDW